MSDRVGGGPGLGDGPCSGEIRRFAVRRGVLDNNMYIHVYTLQAADGDGDRGFVALRTVGYKDRLLLLSSGLAAAADTCGGDGQTVV